MPPRRDRPSDAPARAEALEVVAVSADRTVGRVDRGVPISPDARGVPDPAFGNRGALISRAIETLALCGLLLALASVASAARVEDPDLGFTLDIPEGFEPDPAILGADRDFVHAFAKDDPAGGFSTIIVIERMRGTIGRERLDPAKLPPGFKGKLFTAKWNGFDVEATEVPEELNGVPTINYNAQVPLKREAIQLRVVGPQSKVKELRALLDQLLDGLKGETNWTTPPAPPAASRATGRGRFIVGLLACAAACAVILWLLMRRRRSNRVN